MDNNKIPINIPIFYYYKRQNEGLEEAGTSTMRTSTSLNCFCNYCVSVCMMCHMEYV